MSTIKTSAIKEYNTAVVKQSGRVGTVRYYTKNGLTYVRAASNSSVTNNRTNAQMTQRLMFASLGALYSTLGSHLKGAFPNKAKNQTDFNAFMQANQGHGVYMTKQERALGYSVAMPVVVSSGKLPAVKTTLSGGNAVSDVVLPTASISAGSLDAIKVKALSAAIVAGNEGWAYGDQLTIVVLKQDDTYCKPQYIRIVLSMSDETLMSAYGSFSAVSGKLAMAISGNACVGYIHSKADGAMSLCQLVATDGMVAVINSYLSDEKFSEASASYGTTSEIFLVPSKSSASSGGQSVTKYTLNISSADEGKGTVNSDVNKQYDAGSTVNISATAKSGYTFEKWSDDNTSANRTITMNENKTLVATFKAATMYSLNISSDDTSKGVVNTLANKDYPAGSRVSIFATPEDGYTFDKWSDEDTNSSRTITMNSNVTLVASFKSA